MSNTNEKKCEVCSGLKNLRDIRTGITIVCSFCDGTGESTQASKAILRHHICNCVVTDRKNCGICKSPCHHTPSLGKFVLAGGGYQ